MASSEQLLEVNRNLQADASHGVELIADNKFQAGFLAKPPCNDLAEKGCKEDSRYELKMPEAGRATEVKPVWELGQWGSRSSLPVEGKKQSGGYAWATAEKRLAVYPDGRIEMAVNGESEFQGAYRDEQPAKPSLIAGQTIAAPGDYSRDTGSIADMKRLEFNVEFRLSYGDQNRKQGYNRDRHALIAPINFTIQNLNTKSEGYGQLVWLQINPYDDRLEMPVMKEDQSMMDPKSSMAIFFVPTASLTRGNTHSGDWVRLHGDILRFARRSIQQSFNKGVLKSGDLSDYKIGGVNIGYELSGLNVATIEFRGLSLRMFN
jgi:hypothetical protein